MEKFITNTEFVNIVKSMLNYNTCYMLGAFGHIANEDNIKYEINRTDCNNKPYKDGAYSILNKGFLFDCCGVIKAASWGWCGDMSKNYGGAKYQANGVNDMGADTMIRVSEDVSTDFSNIQVGECVWMKGHIGVYVGDGKVVESTPRWSVSPGVKISSLGNCGYGGDKVRNWTKHGKLPWVNYNSQEQVKEKEEVNMEKKEVFNTVEECPEYAREAVSYFVDNKYLLGTPTGLNLNTDLIRMLTVLYRTLTDKKGE